MSRLQPPLASPHWLYRGPTEVCRAHTALGHGAEQIAAIPDFCTQGSAMAGLAGSPTLHFSGCHKASPSLPLSEHLLAPTVCKAVGPGEADSGRSVLSTSRLILDFSARPLAGEEVRQGKWLGKPTKTEPHCQECQEAQPLGLFLFTIPQSPAGRPRARVMWDVRGF